MNFKPARLLLASVSGEIGVSQKDSLLEFGRKLIEPVQGYQSPQNSLPPLGSQVSEVGTFLG